jgi:AcrR family transcriptional regulator
MSIDKKEVIMNAAIALFAEKGFEGTSIRDLAAKADVNIAMINYYFGSKDKLFEALIEYKASYLRGKLEEINNDKSKSAIQKVDAVIENYVERLLSQPHYHRIIHQALMLQQREEVHQHITQVFTKNTQLIKSIIEQGIKSKEFRKVDAELSIASMLGTINQLLLSKSMCRMLLNQGKDYDPYNDAAFKKRLTLHIRQMMHAHLLNPSR